MCCVIRGKGVGWRALSVIQVAEQCGEIPLAPEGPLWMPRPPSWALCLDSSVCEEPSKAGRTYGKAGSSQEGGDVGQRRVESGVQSSARKLMGACLGVGVASGQAYFTWCFDSFEPPIH